MLLVNSSNENMASFQYRIYVGSKSVPHRKYRKLSQLVIKLYTFSKFSFQSLVLLIMF